MQQEIEIEMEAPPYRPSSGVNRKGSRCRRDSQNATKTENA
jgi:hypothetical protein